jgi:hypothetical protein
MIMLMLNCNFFGVPRNVSIMDLSQENTKLLPAIVVNLLYMGPIFLILLQHLHMATL